jgi:hypothetical protein
LPSTEKVTLPVGAGELFEVTITLIGKLAAAGTICAAVGVANFMLAIAITVMETLMGPAAA